MRIRGIELWETFVNACHIKHHGIFRPGMTINIAVVRKNTTLTGRKSCTLGRRITGFSACNLLLVHQQRAIFWKER
jgi:hypothetical protein